MTKIAKRIKRKLAGFVLWQWRKLSLLSARVYVWLFKNGNNDIEDLDKYLDGDK